MAKNQHNAGLHYRLVTLALVLTALLFCMLIGLPLGIWLARSPRAAKIIRPLLDAMETTPAFVYLVPIVVMTADRYWRHYRSG